MQQPPEALYFLQFLLYFQAVLYLFQQVPCCFPEVLYYCYLQYEVKNSESIKEILDLILERIPGTLDSDDNIRWAEGIGTGAMAEDSNSKELLENSRELVGTSKELLEITLCQIYFLTKHHGILPLPVHLLPIQLLTLP